ncbi:MAG: DUF3341 domain-containing protein [Thiotrichales bacterium]|nr:DUF3341 domain-containing protein [Thiotrichales bacterium]
MQHNLMALFKYEDDFINAAQQLKDSGFDRMSLMSPIPIHAAEKVLGLDKSPVRRFSLVGAILGGLSGFTLAVACALVFILPTGGRAIIAFPPFLVISYEMTILFGVLATLLGFHIVSGLPAWKDKPYRIESNIDRFSLVLGFAGHDDPARAEEIMRAAGAEEIIRVEKPE